MKKTLTARIIAFALACVWILGLLFAAFTFIPRASDLAEEGGYSTGAVTTLEVWMLVTVVVIGAYVAVKAFRFVGRWERGKRDESTSKDK